MFEIVFSFIGVTKRFIDSTVEAYKPLIIGKVCPLHYGFRRCIQQGSEMQGIRLPLFFKHTKQSFFILRQFSHLIPQSSQLQRPSSP